MPTYNSNVLPQSLFINSISEFLTANAKFEVIPLICTDSQVIETSPYHFNNHNYIVFKGGTTLSKIDKMFGKNSDIYKFVSQMMLQNPRNSRKTFIIGNLNGSTKATRGYFETVAITPTKLEAFAEVVNGAFDITIDGGTTKKITKFKGAGIKTIEDLKEKFDNLAIGVDIEITNDNKLRFYSKTAGNTSSVVISASTETGTITDISGKSYLDVSNGESVNGVDPTGKLDESALIEEISNYVYFNVISTTREIDVYGTTQDPQSSGLSKILNTLTNLYLSTQNFYGVFIGTISSLQEAKDVKKYLYANGDDFKTQNYVDVSCGNLNETNTMLLRASITGLAVAIDITKDKRKKTLSAQQIKGLDVSSAQWNIDDAKDIIDCGVHVISRIIGNNLVLDRQSGVSLNTEDKINLMVINRSLVWDLINYMSESSIVAGNKDDIDNLKVFLDDKMQQFADLKVLGKYEEGKDPQPTVDYFEEVEQNFKEKGYGIYIPYTSDVNLEIGILSKLGRNVVSMSLNFTNIV